jgi:hypothetical protein
MNSTSGHSGLFVFRGNVQMHSIQRFESKSGVPLVHTTNMTAGSLNLEGAPEVNGAARQIAGPAILIPRVGFPDRRKLVLLDPGRVVALSDCVIAISGPTRSIHGTWSVLNSGWDSLASLYAGSCAPFVTLAGLVTWLRSAGLTASLRKGRAIEHS